MKLKISNLYVIVLIMVFPLVFYDYYYDIADAKYLFFTSATLLTSFLLIMSVLISSIKKKEYGEFEINITAKWCVLWCILNVISYMISKYKSIALAGTDGRNFGLVTVLSITILFLVVHFSDISFSVICKMFTFTACMVACLGVINSYGFDPIGFYEGVRPDLKMFYQTTIGHIDICATYYAITFPITAFSYMKSKELKMRVFNGIAALVIFAGMFACGCDSGYINLCVTILFMIIFAGDISEINMTGLFVIVLMGLAKIMMIINVKAESAKEMDSIALVFTNIRVVLTVVIAIVIYLIICNITGKMMKKVLYAIVGLFIGVFIVATIYYSMFDRKSDLGMLENLIRFNDEWGSYRGYVWRIACENFSGLPVINKLFGTGPDTIEPVLMINYKKEMFDMFSAYYDNVHNELLQYLCVNGVFGVIAYICIAFSAFISGIKQYKKDETVLPVCMGVICYFVQSFVGINQIMTTPLYFLCMALLARSEKNNKKNSL